MVFAGHRQRDWNAWNQLTSWVEVDLTQLGEKEVQEGIELDAIKKYCL